MDKRLKITEHLINIHGKENYAKFCDRRSGRSNRLASNAVYGAILNPGESHLIVDHFDTRESNKRLLDKILDIAAALNIEFKVKKEIIGKRMYHSITYEDDKPLTFDEAVEAGLL